MPQNKDLKHLIRERMSATGERYTDARAHVLRGGGLGPLPEGWHLTGDRARSYESGLLPAAQRQSADVPAVRLRLREDEQDPYPGFGAISQTIAATRYTGRKVRFSARIRAVGVTGWAGLWLRVDTADGVHAIDNMVDRPARATTGWTGASIVLAVPEQATKLVFGTLLVGAGALDVTRLEFGEAEPDAEPTAGTLPDEPLNLDFDVTGP